MPSQSEVAAFIRSVFRSVWALELLCFLRRNRERALSHDEMIADLRASDLAVTQSVQSLSSAGLIAIEPGGAARYAPANDALEQLATAAEALYTSSPDAVRRLIVTSAAPGLTAFADAFRLRKD